MSEQQKLAPDQAVFSSTDQDVQARVHELLLRMYPPGRRWSVAKTAATLIHIWSVSRLPAATAVRRSARRSLWWEKICRSAAWASSTHSHCPIDA